MIQRNHADNHQTDLQNKTVLRLQTQMKHGVFDHLLKLRIALARNVQCGEQVADQTHEHRQIVSHNLRDVEITQRSHQHLPAQTVAVVRCKPVNSSDAKKTQSA